MRVRELDHSEWEEVAVDADEATRYHTPEWARVWQQSFRWGRPLCVSVEDANKPVAFLPLFETKGKLVSVLGCEYGGPVLLDDDISRSGVLEAVASAYDSPLTVKMHPTLATGDSTESFVDVSDKHTYLLGVGREPAKLLESFRNTTRHAIEHGQKAGLTVDRGGIELVEDFYGPYLSSIKHNSGIPYPKRFFRNMITELGPDAVDIYLARKAGSVVSSILNVHHPGFTHYFKAGNTSEGYELDANPLLIWRSIEDAHERGVDRFDFGATPPGTGLDTFKKGWRGEKRPIEILQTDATGDHASRFPNQNRLKSIWGRLPAWAMNRLSSPALWATN